MTNNIELQKELQRLKDKYPDFLKQVPSNLLEFIFSKETPSKIAMICIESGVENGEKIEKIAYYITSILLGQIAEENLTEILEKEVKLDHKTAKKISIEIKLKILSKIQKIQSEEIQKRENRIEKNQSTQPIKPLLPVEERGSKKSSKGDNYREPIE